jgi:hypothetical protein
MYRAALCCLLPALSLISCADDPSGDPTPELPDHPAAAQALDDFVARQTLREEAPGDMVDIIILVDGSGSMADDLFALGGDLDQLVMSLERSRLDWQATVVSGDDGCSDIGVVERSAVDPVGDLVTGLNSLRSGAYTERLLTLAVVAAGQSGAGECNEGLLREGALLHVITVSDEPEQSLDDWTDLIHDLWDLTDGPGHVRVSAIAGDVPSGCGSATAGYGYWEAAEATGGAFLSICDPAQFNARALGEASVP